MTINLASRSRVRDSYGNGTKDPNDLQIQFVNATDLYLKYGSTIDYNDSESSFWTAYDNVGYMTTYNTNSTWQTIYELTDNAGIVFNMIGPTHHFTIGTGEIAMRVTVDGVEYTIAPSIGTGRRANRLVIGPVFPETPITSSGTERPLSLGSYDDKGFARFLGSANPWDWHATGSQLADPFRAYMARHPYLVFEQSFKYEVYLDTRVTNDYYKNAGINLNYVDNT